MKKIKKRLQESPINYFSDLFIAAMVIVWIVTQAVMIPIAIYVTIIYGDTDMWSYVWESSAVPLTAGGAIWMIKNSVQHAILNSQGEECPKDLYPEVNEDDEIYGQEKLITEKSLREDPDGDDFGDPDGDDDYSDDDDDVDDDDAIYG